MHFGGRNRIFADRREAGRQLADLLTRSPPSGASIVLALPRGGVPVGYEVARALGADLDVLVVRKIGTPGNPELAAGAIASGGVTVYNPDVLDMLGLGEQDLDRVREREVAELARRDEVYRGTRAAPDVRGRTAVLVDDGIATGATMDAAVRAVRQLEPAAVIVAVPTAASDAVARLRRLADQVVCVEVPEPYIGVGAWYASFPQLTDEEVVSVLEKAQRERAGPG
ncbi:MAG: phosphoribosyltransferase [Gammaproteobacteria bacterium]|nr:phosphoribosyltransferase [Gammaproteobacteria bacterium]